VVKPNSDITVVVHEACHAHQHQTILNETGKEPNIELDQWYKTAEARSYAAAIAGLGRPAGWAATTDIEDFASSCMMWLTYPTLLTTQSPERAAWMEANLR
jgi:hypothetical protein